MRRGSFLGTHAPFLQTRTQVLFLGILSVAVPWVVGEWEIANRRQPPPRTAFDCGEWEVSAVEPYQL